MKTWYLITAKADKPAEISIFDEIGMWGVTAKAFIDELRQIASGEINLSINSPGGSVFDALAIYNALRQHAAAINVTIMGVAASAASLVAMAGDRIVMPSNTFMMVHNPMGIAVGNADEMRDWADTLDKIGASLIATYVARTGQPEADIKALLDAETWLTADEAKALGFCDEVQPALKIAASFDIDRLPENVRAAIGGKSAPPADPPAPDMFGDTRSHPSSTLSEQINAVAASFGLGDYVAAWLLDGDITDMAAANAAIAEAREIRDLCAFARVPELAAGLIRSRVELPEARRRVAAHLAERDDSLPTDSHIPSASSKPPKKSAPQAVSPAAYWRSN